jgi:hypothetical protein
MAVSLWLLAFGTKSIKVSTSRSATFLKSDSRYCGTSMFLDIEKIDKNYYF